jgi:hypothetical protein
VLVVCSECVNFLSKHASNKNPTAWSYIWPSFYWDLLSGEDKSTCVNFFKVYEPEHLWRFVPSTLRCLWRSSVMKLYPDYYHFVYDDQMITSFLLIERLMYPSSGIILANSL